MEFLQVLAERRAVREFTDDPITKSTITELVNLAIQAPSAMNLQPWAFAVTLDRGAIKVLGERAKTWLLENESTLGLGEMAQGILRQPGFSIFYGAPALVVVVAKDPGTQAAEDCCLAAQNLMLAARDQGIGSCWIGFARPWLDLLSTKKELDIPARYRVVAPIILGYPKKWPESHGRKAPEIHWMDKG